MQRLREFAAAVLPAQRRGALAARIGDELDVVVLADAVAFLLEPADTLPELVDALGGPGSAVQMPAEAGT